MTRTPYDNLDENGKRTFWRGVYGIFGFMGGGLLSYIGLAIYMAMAQPLNWTLFHVWFASTSLSVTLGVTLINRHLNRSLGPYISADQNAGRDDAPT